MSDSPSSVVMQAFQPARSAKDKAVSLAVTLDLWQGSFTHLRWFLDLVITGDRGRTRHEAVEGMKVNANCWSDAAHTWKQQGLARRERVHNNPGMPMFRYFATPEGIRLVTGCTEN